MPHIRETIDGDSWSAIGEPADEPPQRPGIRRARVSDLPQLIALERASFSSDRFSARTLRALATRASSEMWVAVAGRQPVGYVATLFRSNSRVARVYGLCVARSARGRGLGRALLQKAEQGARLRASRAMRLEVRVDNPAALALYGAAHYTPLRELPGYYADGCAGLRLQKTLSPSQRQGRQS